MMCNLNGLDLTKEPYREHGSNNVWCRVRFLTMMVMLGISPSAEVNGKQQEAVGEPGICNVAYVYRAHRRRWQVFLKSTLFFFVNKKFSGSFRLGSRRMS